MKNSNIRPTGRKGNENINRIKELMGVTTIKEGVNRSVVELTKTGPDDKVYGIVKENNKYFIKVTEKTSNLVAEDFKYIGGLMNKTSEAYSSYAKAAKHLNLKFHSLSESNDSTGNVLNVLINDNLLKESTDINGGDAKVDKKTSGDNVATGDNVGVDDFEKDKADGTKDGDTGTHAEKYVLEDIELSESEAHIDEMISGDSEECDVEAQKEVNETISIAKAMNEMDSIIDSVYGESQEKVNGILEGLTETEMNTLINTLKKKV